MAQFGNNCAEQVEIFVSGERTGMWIALVVFLSIVFALLVIGVAIAVTLCTKEIPISVGDLEGSPLAFRMSKRIRSISVGVRGSTFRLQFTKPGDVDDQTVDVRIEKGDLSDSKWRQVIKTVRFDYSDTCNVVDDQLSAVLKLGDYVIWDLTEDIVTRILEVHADQKILLKFAKRSPPTSNRTATS